jgi:hypothetical protein
MPRTEGATMDSSVTGQITDKWGHFSGRGA